MGRFFSNIQIKNNRNENKAQFSKKFCKLMENKGYIASTEDDASIAYILAFSQKDSWITLCSAEYESGGESLKKDVQFFSEELKTCCISTTVIDSDFSILEMYNATSSMIDMVIVGAGGDYGFPDGSECRGKRENWESLLVENSTWEKLSEIWSGNHVFTENALSEMAILIGVDPQNIISDYEDLTSRNDENIAMLYFKKKDNKTLTLNAAFKKVFGEALEPLGFKKIKSKHPYFVRVVPGGEIIHVITYTKRGVQNQYYGEFCVFSGVATVFRKSIDLEKSPLNLASPSGQSWITGIESLYALSNISNWENELYQNIAVFSYNLYNGVTIEDAVKQSLGMTKKIVMPILDNVLDIESFINYCIKFKLPISLPLHYENVNFANNWPSAVSNEGLLWVKLNNRNAYLKLQELAVNIELAIIARWIKDGKTGHTQDYYNEYHIKMEERKMHNVIEYDEIFNDHEWIAKAHIELEFRKESNTKTLRSYGLNI